MIVKTADTVEKKAINSDGAKYVQKQVLVGAKDGAPHFTMRRFTIAPGGHTYCHAHNFEHEVYILQGKGIAMQGNQEIPVEKDMAILVEPNEMHQFRNTGEEDLVFLCFVMNEFD